MYHICIPKFNIKASNFRMFADFRKLAALIFSRVFLFFTGFAHNDRAAGYDFNKNLFFGG